MKIDFPQISLIDADERFLHSPDGFIFGLCQPSSFANAQDDKDFGTLPTAVSC